MINRQIRLTMRAFNNECEAAIANTRWNNVNAMEKRILNAATQINNANESMRLTISDRYVALKLDELHLAHEYRERLKIEREERAEMARAEREEKKLLAEAEAAEREEQRFQNLLDKARAEAGIDETRIAELEAALAEAHAKSERARAMAEMTKSGYVYIISNVGSFGEDVVKIGLTRRLDPDDRVRELGDASVPFSFDTHAMIYSDEAPGLEYALHREFADRRINGMNMRKEFFRVSLDEVEDAVRRLAPTASFFKDREAQEWHETLARRYEALLEMQAAADTFPAAI
jgi:FKBP-type peptidyl-prolyl cis-trans isomerase